MKTPDKLNKEEISQIIKVMLDSKLQNELMNDVNHPNIWMLDYVFDSKLRQDLELYDLKLTLEEKLIEKNKPNITKV